MAQKQKDTKTPKIGWASAHALAREYIKFGYNIMFTGAPGIGKTALIKLLAWELKYNLVIFHPVISDPTDFRGIPWLFKDDKGKEHCVFVPFDQFLQLINAKGPTICFLDDLGQAPVAVQAAAMQLLHGGTLNAQKISKEVRFVACTNRKQDRAGVTGILEPVKSRFHGIFELVPELDPFVAHIIKEQASPVLVAFMRSRPDWLTGGDGGWRPESDIVNQPCPRTIEHLSDVINMKLSPNLRPTAYAGAVGEGMANEYMAFENMALTMPDIDTILTDPHTAQRPATNEISYAMIGALHARMTRKNLSNIYTYITRNFNKELQAVFHWDVELYQPNLIEHTAYVNWSQKNGDLFSN